MKSFIFKILNIALICAIIFMYQNFAASRQTLADAYDQAEEEVSMAEASIEAEKAQAAAEAAARKYKNGEFTGSGDGFGGKLTVKLTIVDDRITDATLVSSNDQETVEYLNDAVSLLDDVVKKQSTDVDTVSGATLSSNGLIEACENALKEARNE